MPGRFRLLMHLPHWGVVRLNCSSCMKAWDERIYLKATYYDDYKADGDVCNTCCHTSLSESNLCFQTEISLEWWEQYHFLPYWKICCLFEKAEYWSLVYFLMDKTNLVRLSQLNPGIEMNVSFATGKIKTIAKNRLFYFWRRVCYCGNILATEKVYHLKGR